MRVLLVPACAALLLLAGCTNPQGTAGPSGDRTLTFEPIQGCNSQSARENYTIIATQAEWETFWRTTCDGAVMGQPVALGQEGAAPPAIDFSKRSVVVALWGEKRTGGYAIRVTNITEAADHVAIVAERLSPGSNCAVAQFVSHPADLVSVERLSKAARFSFRDATQSC